MDCVESIEELIKQLNSTETSDHGKIFKKMNIPPSDFESFGSWGKEGYTRNCINRTNEYELILLCWKKGDSTPIHDHGGQKCWVYQVEGSIHELRYEKIGDDLIEVNRMQLDPGRLTFMNNAMGYHRLSNATDGRAMTLHVYVSPIDCCQVYCDENNHFLQKDLAYDTATEDALAVVE